MPQVIFTSNDTWVAPFTGSLTQCDLYATSGAGSDTDGVNGGAGGGGGGYSNGVSQGGPASVVFGTSYPVGVGGSGPTFNGAAAFNGSSGSGTSGGSGGAATTWGFAGGNGGNGGAGTEGGGGGGGAGPGGAGTAGIDGQVSTPGTGGAGGPGNSGSGGGIGGNGNDGAGPYAGQPYSGGGGGGGVINPGAGGGDPGAVILGWSWPTPNPQGIFNPLTGGSTGFSAGGYSVTIEDGSFTSFSGGCTVTIGGIAATSVVVVDADTITCIMPALTGVGPFDVVVTNADDSASGTISGGWTGIVPDPTAISVPAGLSAGGTSVTITDSSAASFAPGCTVKFGANSATSVVVVDANTITCVTPAGASGYVDVTVSDTAGNAGTISNGFYYVAGGGGGGGGSIIGSAIILPAPA